MEDCAAPIVFGFLWDVCRGSMLVKFISFEISHSLLQVTGQSTCSGGYRMGKGPGICGQRRWWSSLARTTSMMSPM